MKTILHFANYDTYNQLGLSISSMAHLITYEIFFSEYEPIRVKVVKNRNGIQGIDITKEQLLILQDCVVNDKHQPEFMMSNYQKSQKIIREENTRKEVLYIWDSRLRKLEDELFPCGYRDCDALKNIQNPLCIFERLSRIREKLGVELTDECSLDNLEKCEFWLKDLNKRLNNLECDIYPSAEEIFNMKPVTTLDGQLGRLEKKLGVNFIHSTIADRLTRIEATWICRKKLMPVAWEG